ncbi:hypothetical protein CEXT_733251 [Caerostris extrusa]|uniref:Uncharacterized protein n=1 Tax=Caerostris extrusa TaxID=172846 RepID=A0AAV4R1Q9_CAEEX|nr:hypothetical protein CEXT_733251 [Caerostris extrusa]
MFASFHFLNPENDHFITRRMISGISRYIKRSAEMSVSRYKKVKLELCSYPYRLYIFGWTIIWTHNPFTRVLADDTANQITVKS